MAIKKARSVRVISLCDINVIKNGLCTYDQIGIALSNFITNDNVPIFYLFNKYRPPIYDEESYQKWFGMNINDKNASIKKEIEDSKKRICDAIKTQQKEASKRIIKRAKDMGIINNNQNDLNAILKNEELKKQIENDTEYRKLNKQVRYCNLMEKSFKEGNYGYIDPTSTDSVILFLKNISKLKTIDASYLSSSISEDSVHFNKIFEKTIRNETIFEKKLCFFEKYPEDIFEKIIGEIDDEIEKLNDKKSKLQICIEQDDKSEILTFYRDAQVSLTNSLQILCDKLPDLTKKQCDKEKELQKFLDRKPEEIWSDDFYEEKSFYVTHETYYPLDIPYVNKDIELGDETSVQETIAVNNREFHVIYCSHIGVNDALQASGVLVASSSLPFIGPIIGGVIAGYTIARHHVCSGHVRLYAYPKDIYPDIVNDLKDDIQIIKKRINDIKQIIANA